MNKIALLLVLYNDIEHLERLLLSLDNQDAEYEIFAVDCHERQESMQYLKNVRPGAHTYDYQGNLGYAVGNNFLAQKAIEQGFEYLMICNTDVILGRNVLNVLQYELLTSKYVAVTPLVYAGTPENTIDIYAFGMNLNFKTMLVSIGYKSEKGIINLSDTFEVNFLPGCMFMVKSSEFKKVGLFSTYGFMYGEERDFAYRIKKHDFKCIASKNAVVWHNHNTAERNINSLAQSYYYINRNFILFCNLYGKYYAKYRKLLLETFYLPYKSFKYYRKYGCNFIRLYYKGFIDGCKNIHGKK